MSLPAIPGASRTAPATSDEPVRARRPKAVFRSLPKGALTLQPLHRAASVPLLMSSDDANLHASATPEPQLLEVRASVAAGRDSVGYLRHERANGIVSKATLERWEQELARDAAKYSSVTTYCDLTLQRVIAETRTAPQPSTLRVAVVCMLLDRLITVVGPQRDLIARLHDELFNAVFTGWADYRAKKGLELRRGAANENTANTRSKQYDQQTAAALGANESAVTAANLQQRQTYFQAHADLQDKRVQVIGRPARVVNMILDFWRMRVQGIFFGVWRGWVDRQLSVQRRAVEYTKRKRNLKDQARVVTHFTAWRKYVFERRHQCRVIYEEETRVKLVHRMGRRIQELENENKSLKHRYDRLFDSYCDAADRVTSMDTMWADFKARATTGGTTAAAQATADDAAAKVTAASSSTPSPRGGNTARTARPDGNDAAAAAGASSIQAPSAASVNDAIEEPEKLLERLHDEVYQESNAYLVDRAEAEYAATSAEPKKARRGAANVAPTPPPEATGKVAQLAQYLEGLTATAVGGSPTAPAAKKQQASKSKSPTRSPINPAHAGDDGAETPTAVDNTPVLDYKTVLEWVTARVQLFMTEQTVMKRCANFTIDFKDSVRLAYLLMSLGADRSLADEVCATKDLVERAELVCEAAAHFHPPKPLMALEIAKGKGSAIAAFLFHLYSRFAQVPLVLPSSSINPRLLAQLQFGNNSFGGGNLSMTSPTVFGTAAKQRASQLLFAAGTSFASASVPAAAMGANLGATPGGGDSDGFGRGNVRAEDIARAALTSPEGPANASFTVGPGLDATVTSDDVEPLPDRQYLIWYKELAAEDSDTEDAGDYVDPQVKKRSAMDELAARLSQRTELSRQRTEAVELGDEPPSPNNGGRGGGQRGGAANPAVYKGPPKTDLQIVREHAARTKVRLVRWLADTMNPLGAPASDADGLVDKTHRGRIGGDEVTNEAFWDPKTMSNADLVDAVTRTLVPEARLTRRPPATVAPTTETAKAPPAIASAVAAKKEERIRLKQLEQRLTALHLGKVRLRQPQGAKAEDNVISLSQLMTALYVMNVRDPVVIV
jgi:hypothetical protein